MTKHFWKLWDGVLDSRPVVLVSNLWDDVLYGPLGIVLLLAAPVVFWSWIASWL